MRTSLMTLPEVARYLGVPSATLACAICNRGTLDKVPLPAAVDDTARAFILPLLDTTGCPPVSACDDAGAAWALKNN